MTEETTPVLMTPYTEELGVPHKLLHLLHRIRAHDFEEGPIPIRMPSTIREVTRVGQKPFALRNFQTQMTAHLIKMPRFINGDGVGLGKSATAIVASAFLREKHENKLKILVFGTKSTTHQWKDEGFDEFTTLRTEVMSDTHGKLKGHEARLAQLKAFLEEDQADVMICKYTSFIGRRKKLEGEFDEDGVPIERGQKEEISQEMRDLLKLIEPHGSDLILICDECQKFKGTASQIRKLVMYLSRMIGRVWAMTATVIQNSLDEFYSIASAIGIRPFGNMFQFRERFCIYRDTYIGNGRTVPQLVGYKNVKDFKIGMRPFYYGRSQAQVKEKLPRLTTQFYPIELNEKQIKILKDIQTGKFVLPPAIKKIGGEFLEKERDPSNLMTQMAIMQQTSNHACLIESADSAKLYSAPLSPKEELLFDLLDGKLDGEKVLVFSKSRRWIDRLIALCSSGATKRKSLRITGSESEAQRAENKRLFQTTDDYNLMFINTAIMEGANLQQSAHMILLDAPFGWGALIQLVGRMVRMGSPHAANTLHIFVAKGTIDEYTIDVLRGKKGVFQTILGDSHADGLLDTEANDLDLASGMEAINDDREFRALLAAHVRTTPMRDFLDLTIVEAVQKDENYEMVFDKKSKQNSKAKEFRFSDKW